MSATAIVALALAELKPAGETKTRGPWGDRLYLSAPSP
jgi:hypothetical protein